MQVSYDDHPVAAALRTSFAQPTEQRLPSEFLALLIALDRSKRSGPLR